MAPRVLRRGTSQAPPMPLSCSVEAPGSDRQPIAPSLHLAVGHAVCVCEIGATAILTGGETEALEGEGTPTARWWQGQ